MLFCIDGYSQSLTPKEWNKIQKSGDYIIGMGMSESMDQARQVAMGDLVGKISTKVESQFQFILTNKDNAKSEGQMEKIIRSYSSTRLDNVEEYIDKDHGKFVVYRYIKNSDLRAMFKRRISMAKNWAKEGIEREKEGKIGDALQNFYWSLALLRSCPDGDLETISQDYVEQNVMMDIQQRVKSIFENISIKAVASEKEGYSQRLTLNIDYKNKPVTNFYYMYSDGKSSSEVFAAKDGIGELLLPPNAKTKKLKINAEYEGREEANIQPDLRSVMSSLDPVAFRGATLDVDIRSCPLVNSADYVMMIAGEDMPQTNSEQSMDVFALTMQTIEKGIAQKNYSNLEGCFTSEGWDMFGKLVKYGNAKLLRAPQVQFIPDGQNMVCRSFPMSFAFQGNKRVFTEDVVFYLNGEGKVYEVAFGLEKRAVDDIMNRGEWSDEARKLMIHFMETYKTAYALKRLDYINGIFSQDALIITGSIVRGTGQKEMQPAKTDHVKYTRQTKEQYMKNLEKCFRSNEYINLHFADNIVRRSGTKPDIYGIQIKQDYYSSTYGDTGYLFLLIDFQKPEEPLIHVRTWQPDDDPNVKDGRIGIADFLL
ncbi:MAG: LPP20 family lipoprotein [Prevotella sp.]|nr:LPP20 family lipoprotein [Prevotella sp.]